jgi:proline iminopeptidase
MLDVLLYPPLEPNHWGQFPVDEIHTLYWEDCGNPQGIPIVFLHGGPGAPISPQHRRFFDPHAYRIILFDQRGTGRSTPHAEIRNNTTSELIEDLEKLRQHLGIKQWLIFGGSWGSTLAIAYGEAYPQSCLGFILRGIWLMTDKEIEWFFYGAHNHFPEAWHKFATFIPESERGDLLKAYHQRVTDPDPVIHMPAARVFTRYEEEISYLLPSSIPKEGSTSDSTSLSMGRIETHYMYNHAMLGQRLLDNITKISHLPAFIIHGRYDSVCPLSTAWKLANVWPKAELHIVPLGGHSAFDPEICTKLLEATDRFKALKDEWKSQ